MLYPQALRPTGAPVAPGTGNSSLNYPPIQYADILLVYTEAQKEIGLNVDAYNGLKAIRGRAGLVTPDLGTFSKVTFQQAV
ncbi:MAG: RagB/SusD family nutrient uptake outer membrane protein [Chryseolinea sp.]